MAPIVIRASRWRQITPLLICLGVLIVSTTYLIKADSMLLLIPLIAIFGGGTAYYIRQLWVNPKQLVIDDEGVWHAGWMISKVRWNELQRVFVKPAGPKEYLCFTANNREALRLQMTSLGRTINDATQAADCGDLCFNTISFNLSAHEIVAFANNRISES